MAFSVFVEALNLRARKAGHRDQTDRRKVSGAVRESWRTTYCLQESSRRKIALNAVA